MLKNPFIAPTHKIDSKLGGVFDVIVLTETNDKCLIEIVCPGTDFNGKIYKVNKSELMAI